MGKKLTGQITSYKGHYWPLAYLAAVNDSERKDHEQQRVYMQLHLNKIPVYIIYRYLDNDKHTL